jgi:dipeptidyl aminopeptidase/acylaminoacyl peptidase
LEQEQNTMQSPSTQREEQVSAILDTILDIRNPNDVDITADGSRIAFVVWEPAPGARAERPKGRIWVTDVAKNETVPFLSGKANEISPRWSPDGKHLAFITTPEGEKEKPQLYVIAATGGEPRLVYKMPNGVSTLSWSPDGTQIAFLSQEGEAPQTDPIVLSPERHQRLWTVRLQQARPEPVTPKGFTVWEYDWSSDSKQFALYYSAGSDRTDWYHSQIGVIAADGGTIKQLTNLTLPTRGLSWSPDSKQIIYLSGKWSDPGRGSGDIFAVSVSTKEVRNLTPGIDCSPAWCRWLPDNRNIIFTALKDVTHQIGLLDSQSGAVRILTEDFVMQWDQPALSMTADFSQFVTIHSSSQQPPEIWSGTLQQEQNTATAISWQQVTRLNASVAELHNLTASERIRYESVDGWQIDGIFFTPTTDPSGKLPPLYVNVHGGPSGADSDGWDGTDQFFVTAGYAVFHPNMRGSWGHGAAFANAVIGDMGGKDLQDILNGVDYLIRQGRVDGDRVTIGGWSNGGFLSAWAITRTPRFKAAMVGAGITDWVGMHAQTDLADADILLLDADPLQTPEAFHRNSPLTYAGKITTPTLILHGQDDQPVPVALAYGFYRALRANNVPVECVVYPREGHGLSEREHLRESLQRQLKWFDRYTRTA